MTRQSTILVGLLSIVAWFMKFGHFVSAQDVATSPGQDQPIGCTLQCQNNSTCISGEADFSMFPRPNGEVMNFLEETNRQGFHCLCPDSFAGILCNRQYEVCENQNHVCYHGGKCLNQGDQITQVCDCSSASFQGRQYQGPFCEQAVTTSVEICDNSRRTFCLNGKCNDEFSLTPNKNLCKCDEGFYGEHCELSVDHYKPDCSGSTCEVGDGALDGNRKAENKNSGEEDCSLDCKHGGVCTKANKYLDDLTGNHNLDFLSAFNDQNFEHCVCAEGWTGSLCTTKIEVCGNDKHICLHGSRCMEHEDGGYWCDCSEAFTVESRFAGDFCQHHHTEVCTDTGQLQFTGGLADHGK